MRLQDGRHVCNLLGHSQQALRHELNDLLVQDLCKGAPMVMDLVGRNVPLCGFGIEFNPRNDPALIQDEGFVGVVQGSEWKIDLGGQIHIHCEDANVGC